MTDTNATVLVTGGTGFLGGWCVAELLRRGYEVRTTVRDISPRGGCPRGGRRGRRGRGGSRLSVLAADLKSDDGWPEAVAGCRYVLHVASPFPAVQPKDPDELIVPARDGARRVVRAALDAGVERIGDDLFDRRGPPVARELRRGAVHGGRLDRRQRTRPHAVLTLQDAGRAGRVGARARCRRGGTASPRSTPARSSGRR